VCSLPHGMFLLCMGCCIIAVGLLSSVFREKGLYVFVLEAKGVRPCVFLNCCIHIYEYFCTPVYCCLLEEVELGECLCSPEWEVFILLPVNIWTCPCAGSFVSEGSVLVLLLGYLGTVNWTPSWVSRLLESLGNQEILTETLWSPLKPIFSLSPCLVDST